MITIDIQNRLKPPNPHQPPDIKNIFKKSIDNPKKTLTFVL
jgi:hypothetical protein